MMAFTEAQLKSLEAKLDAKYVRTRRAHDTTLAYVEGWHVIAEANRVMNSMFDATKATIYIKDGSTFDEPGEPPSDYDALADVEVEDLEARQLFIVRITVPYNSISLFPSGFWHTHVHDLTLSGQAAMRHE